MAVITISRQFGQEDYEDPALYHLILNTSKLSLDDACEHIRMLVQ